MELIHYIEEIKDQFEAAQIFFGHGTDNALDEAVYLVYGALGISFQEKLDQVNRKIKEDELLILNKLVKKRIEQHIPVAYLLNEAWFADLKFYCDERALVPRSPMAELIINRFQPLLNDEPNRVLDLCCGGGCIGIATANYLTNSQVDLADIDTAALELAQNNIKLHELAARVETIRSDLFASIEKSYDLILCNPPYVSQKEYESLPLEFKAEPHRGLVSDQEGLDLPVKIIREAATHLSADGLLIMEVGYSAELLAQRYSTVPFLWLEFANGGEGVFALSRAQLEQYSEEFN
ncbi:MAG: 50S ribosomal protein L3 N(5)-glutamine methyltransferase [Pseudomonadales bacterium]|nr:50S ribosomal protein L3 N(5)-glutamine methyltransferase [Pseudomonadales bacterium]